MLVKLSVRLHLPICKCNLRPGSASLNLGLAAGELFTPTDARRLAAYVEVICIDVPSTSTSKEEAKKLVEKNLRGEISERSEEGFKIE